MQCLRGQADLLPDGGPLAALGCAPEEVEGEAAWRRRGRPGAHLGEQPKQRRPLRQEPAMRWRPPSREERGAARRERLGGGDLSVERIVKGSAAFISWESDWSHWIGDGRLKTVGLFGLKWTCFA